MFVKSNKFGALNSQSKDRRLKFCDRFQNAKKRLRESGRHQFRRAVRQRWNPFDCRPSTLREHAGDEVTSILETVDDWFWRICWKSSFINYPFWFRRNDKPFSEWTSDNICEWLKELGLDSSVPEARRWVKSGQMLLTASSHEIDKELNVKVCEVLLY